MTFSVVARRQALAFVTDVSGPEVKVRNSGAGASARAACGTCLLECNVGGMMSLVLRTLSFARRP